MTVSVRSAAPGLLGIGYQGQELGDFVARLVEQGVARLVDVRLTPVSRKRGFSKTALGLALTDAGIAYEHRPELGNPKENRPGFAGSAEELACARGVFAALLRQPAAQRSLAEVAEVARHERIALLCFEADQERCHRDVILSELAARIDQRLG